MNANSISVSLAVNLAILGCGQAANTILLVDSFSDQLSIDLSSTTGYMSNTMIIIDPGSSLDEAVREINFTVTANPFFDDAIFGLGYLGATGIATYDTGPGVVSKMELKYTPKTALDVTGSTGLTLDLLFTDRPMDLTLVLGDAGGESSQTLHLPGGAFTKQSIYFPLDQFSRAVDLEGVNSIGLFVDPDTSADFAFDSLSFVSVPEPQTALLSLGAVFFGLLRRRR